MSQNTRGTTSQLAASQIGIAKNSTGSSSGKGNAATSKGLDRAEADTATCMFIKLVHDLARSAKGKVVVAGFGENPDTKTALSPIVHQSDVGDVKATLRSVRKLGKQEHRNTYISLGLMRSDLEPKKKGSEDDVVAVLGLVMDFDAKDGKAQDWRAKLDPFEPTIVLETSSQPAGSFQCFFLFRQPIEASRAKELAEQLTTYSECDHASKDISHVWRIPDTLNWPNRKKISEYGRPKSPQNVKVVIGYDKSRLVDPDTLETLLLGKSNTAQELPGPLVQSSESNTLPALDCGQLQRIEIEELFEPDAPWKQIPTWVRGVILDGEHPQDPERYETRSEAVFAVTCALVRCDVPDVTIASVLLNPDFLISEHIFDQAKPKEYALRQISNAREKSCDAAIALNPKDPMFAAREFVRLKHPTLINHKDEFLTYDGAAYVLLEDKTVRSQLYRFLEKATCSTNSKDGPVSVKPNKSLVNDVFDALEGITHLASSSVCPPCWLDGNGPPSNEIVALKNGLLHLPSGELLPSSAQYFTRNALEFNYDPCVPTPTRWLSFLRSIWPDDEDSIELLQMMFGYLLTSETYLQKVFLLVGPPRSGKGTIANVLTNLIGSKNYTAPSLSNLNSNFSLQPLLGKQLAVISDMRVSRKTDHAAIAENLLRVSGEDSVTVHRKYKLAWEGTLQVRFLIMTNILPNISDASGALANRYVPLVMRRSFLGKEDVSLREDLKAELPAILNWAVEGWQWLRALGRIDLPESSRNAVAKLTRLASPTKSFVEDCCVLEAGARVGKDELFESWLGWCDESDYPYSGSKERFSRNLFAAEPSVQVSRPRAQSGERIQVFKNIRLREKRGIEAD